MKGIIILITIVIVLISLISAANANRFLDQHNAIVQDQKMLGLDKFNTYLISEITPEDELIQIWHRTKELRSYRLQKTLEREQLEKDLEKKSKHWTTIIGNDVYYGFDEEIHGTKEFYFYWV